MQEHLGTDDAHSEESPLHEQAMLLYHKLLKLEENVQLYRSLFEQEEQAQYIDAPAALQAAYAELQAVREAQGFCLTPWVCT